MTAKVVLASNNPGKVKEFQQLLSKASINVIPQKEFNVPEVEETGLSFVENAIIKARHASLCAQLPAIADDSGLEVDFLDGAPGIYSSRFAGEQGNDRKNNAKLLGLLRDVPSAQRTARFQCLLVYLRHPQDATPHICQGTWEGRILAQPQGNNGFGYDPVFFVPERDCSSAQLSGAEKNILSHRSKAMVCLLDHLRG
ncbi:MAG: non-canonical purine NTP pyrophosphatase, RdgB/HAM1 family [Gammaproteobacteria bacterium]|nr:MAG: non-canonical purine NTP pyrophosphatase, RdgB/HAM1 family [Gammaproteobacteria bacterium]RLA50581.1 MAG: non-canonical purine NTP pyrophosphatase, RdgB/HAM1 family [Gammaproteobacteria bacterium]